MPIGALSAQGSVSGLVSIVERPGTHTTDLADAVVWLEPRGGGPPPAKSRTQIVMETLLQRVVENCRLVVAAPTGSGFAPDRVSGVRVATKYPRVTASHFLGRGLAVEVVKLAGSVEIAPGLGLADCIVDVVETGRTLLENGPEVIETVAESSARLIVNRASFHARRDEVQQLIRTLQGVAA